MPKVNISQNNLFKANTTHTCLNGLRYLQQASRSFSPVGCAPSSAKGAPFPPNASLNGRGTWVEQDDGEWVKGL